MPEATRERKADETLQEHLVRADERDRVLEEIAGDQEAREVEVAERDKAVLALLIFGTLAGAILLPAWAAIIGFAVWLFRLVSGL